MEKIGRSGNERCITSEIPWRIDDEQGETAGDMFDNKIAKETPQGDSEEEKVE